MRRTIAAVAGALLLFSHQALAWNANGHRIVGAIADEMLTPNAKQQVEAVLAVNLSTAGPWLDCVKSVHRFADGTFHYVLEPAFEEPCKPFSKAHSVMQQYVKRNFFQCSYLTKRTDDDNNPYQEEMGCHNTYHFADLAIQRDHFDRNFQGTNDHDIVATITAAIAVLLERPSPPPFKIADKREALFLLAHLVGDLHQPLHVGSVYLDQNGSQVDPDVTHTIDPATETIGGNAIKDGSKNFHSEWDAPPTGFKVEQALDLLPLAKQVPLNNSRMEEWSTAWATDTLKVAPQAFANATFAKTNDGWSIAFPNHDTYVQQQDDIKRQQLAKAGARLAQILNKIWP